MASQPPPQPPPLTIPSSFLTGPAPPTCTTTRLDFAATPVPAYANCYATVIDDALTPSECATLLRLAHAANGGGGGGGAWERAMINVGGGRQALATETRNCGRVIVDAPDVAARLWARVAPLVPELAALEGARWCVPGRGRAGGYGLGLGSVLHDRQVARGERWACAGLNERLRFLRYERGEYFRPHQDGAYETPDKARRSFFTLHLYLNDGEEVVVAGEEDGERGSPFVGEVEGEPAERLRGGATTFHGPEDLFTLSFGEPDPGALGRKVEVFPKVGRVLLFQHRHMLHSGADVLAGVKYTMRTDVMYAKEAREE